MLLLSTHNICFGWEIRKKKYDPLLSTGLSVWSEALYMLNSTEHELILLINVKMPTIVGNELILLINVKMPTIVGNELILLINIPTIVGNELILLINMPTIVGNELILLIKVKMATIVGNKLILLINVKMPTIVGISTIISRINTKSESFKTRKVFTFQHFVLIIN